MVSIAVEGLAEPAANAAIAAAFGAVARVHALMSYHEPQSDLSNINRRAADGPVAVDRSTLEVLSRALALSEMSDGVFDPVVAAALEAAGVLPVAEGPAADPQACWRDVRLNREASTVAFDRPLRIDLGGIAKGYAVDQAIAALRACDAQTAVVNAGGDLRAFGEPIEVVLRTGDADEDGAAVLELADAAVASSGSLCASTADEPLMALHFAGAGGPVVRDWFACVTAAECVTADALTKVVLAKREDAAPLLSALGAEAHLLGPDRIWRSFGGVPCDA